VCDLTVETDCKHFMEARLAVLEREPATVERLAAANELPDATFTSSGDLKITPLDKAVPDDAETLTQQIYSLLPHLKITELLLEVDGWTSFTQHFKQCLTGRPGSRGSPRTIWTSAPGSICNWRRSLPAGLRWPLRR